MSPPIILNTKRSQNSPSQITRQSIITTVAKCTLLLLALPVTLVLLAVLKGDLVRWVKGTPKTSDASRTPQECWQLIEIFIEEEGLDPLEVPASQLDVLKQDRGFLPAIVELLNAREIGVNDKYKIIKSALEACCIASYLGNPEGILTRLTEHLSAVRKPKSDKSIYFKNCIKSIFQHCIDKYAAVPCVDDFFKDCSDTQLAKICMDTYFERLSSVEKATLFKDIKILRLIRFFDENINSKILLTKICENILTFDIGYKIEDYRCVVDIESLFYFLGIDCNIEIINTYGKEIRTMFNEQKARLHQE